MADLIIKKYPNRRLYNTNTSQYITLDDIKKLVDQHTQFKVIDAKTKEDMTNYVLLQIINEQENGKFPIFTTELLQHIIRFYGNPVQRTFTDYLEKTISVFNQPLSAWQQTMTDIFSPPKKKTRKKSKTK